MVRPVQLIGYLACWLYPLILPFFLIFSFLFFPSSSSSHSPPTMNVLSKPLALITTTTISVVSLLTAAAAGISLSTRPGLRKARFVLHLGVYVGTLAVCSVLGVVYSVLLTLIGQVSRSSDE